MDSMQYVKVRVKSTNLIPRAFPYWELIALTKGKALEQGCEVGSLHIKANLHDASLTHATSLPRACNMTWDHLHVHDFFQYAKVCARIYRAKQMVRKYFSCPAL